MIFILSNIMKTIYPKCANSFKLWCLSNKEYNKFYKSLGEPSLFDVSLRDGLQSLSKSKQLSINMNEKINIYKNIVEKYNPKNLEIGSLVSEKILPIFSDTLPLLEMTNDYDNESLNNQKKINKYILIPNKDKLNLVINNPNITFFSFITSVSNSFQLKNTKKSLKDSDKELYEMLYDLENKKEKNVVKLYVSCINECPIEGKIDNDFIVYRILQLNKMNIDNICLSDTCGTLNPEDFEYIIDTCKIFGLPMSKISLHLHVNPDKINIIEQIIWMALDRKIKNFDVSNLKTGGCSLTMNKSRLTPNLSYEIYYQALCKYIIKKND